ncbi:hypothetical protein D5S17_16545 [Pseudonocardiaceae bacterium YIM PH 21723]|nr:hypothetical protein D5S17_16545 [Pseudonocardiaceae bacterium YIM PH 21723]
MIFAVIVIAVPAYFLLAAFLPRWWAQTIGDQVQQSFLTGTMLGGGIGFVFTALPLLATRVAVRKNASLVGRAFWAVVALLLAVPNLLTLIVVLGSGSGAHAGQRIMDVLAPAFRGATLVGVILAAVLLLAIQALSTTRTVSRRLRERKAAAPSG